MEGDSLPVRGVGEEPEGRSDALAVAGLFGQI